MTVPADHRIAWMRGQASSLAACDLEETTWGRVVEWATTEPERSAETMADYHAQDSQERHRLKRVAWVVGARIVGGHRLAAAVAERTLLTIDIDDMTPEALMDLEFCRAWPRGWAYCGHTTRSSTPEAPRVRLLLPLREPVDSETYRLAALGLCVLLEAASVDEAGCQHMTVDRATSCDPARLIYGPSLCLDAPHVAIHSEGDWPDVPVLVAAGRAEEARERGVATTPAVPPRSAASARAAQPWEAVGRDVVDDHGVEAMRAAGAAIYQSPRRASELTTHCPWHDDRSPSLDIAADGRMVCRAGCRPGGQPITWARVVARLRGCSEGEALRWARDLAGLPQRQVAPPALDAVALLEDVGEEAGDEETRGSFRFRPVAKLQPVGNLRDYRLWGEWITKTSVTILTGSPGIGKSTMSRNLVAALADGHDYLGVDGPGRPIQVAVLDYETAPIFEHYNWAQVYGDQSVLVENVVVAETPPALTARNLPELLATLEAIGPDLVMVDTLSAAFVVEDENNNAQMEGIIRILRAIARTGPAVLAIAHPSKAGDDLRGASALLGGLDTLLTYTFEDGTRPVVVDETTRFLLAAKKNRVGASGTLQLSQDGEGGLVSIEEEPAAVRVESQRVVLSVIEAAGMPLKRDEIATQAASRGVSSRAAIKALTTLVARGTIVRAGKGRYRVEETAR